MRRHLAVSLLVLAFAMNALSRAADPPSIEKLVEQLGSRAFAERERASKLLRERGPAALPALRKALASPDEEVRKRAEVLVPGLEIEEALLPTRVTVSVENRRLNDVLQDLGKQTGFQLQIDGRDTGRTVNMSVKDAPFWDVLEQLGKQTGHTPQYETQNRQVRLQPAARRSPFVNVRGPFRLEATWFHEDRDIDLASGEPETAGRRDHRLTLAVSVLSEPRITLLQVRPANVEEAVDHEGKSLLESATAEENGPLVAPGRLTFRGEGLQSADVRLRRAGPGARTARVIRGTIPVKAILIRKPVVVSSKVMEAGGTSFAAGTETLHIKQVRNQGGGNIEVEIRVPQERGQHWQWHDRFHVEDDAGNKFQNNGRGTSSNGREYWISLYYSPPFGKKAGPPARLVFESWVIHEHAIPFEFRDVPLP